MNKIINRDLVYKMAIKQNFGKKTRIKSVVINLWLMTNNVLSMLQCGLKHN